MNEKLKIIFFGTPEFASSQLVALINAGFEVAAVVTVPDKPAGRGKKLTASHVKETALKYNLPILQPEKLKSPEFLDQLETYNANLFIVVAFRMLPAVVWKMPALGTFNLHASLLPQYRGAAPINHAIINGETETGITTFFINEEIDKGGILIQQKVPIEPSENAGQLHDKLMLLGNDLVVKTTLMISNGTVTPVQQETVIYTDKTPLRDAPKLDRSFCEVDWTKDSAAIYNHIRGLSPYPAAHAQLVSEEGNTLDLKIFETEITAHDSHADLNSVITDGKTFLKINVSDASISLKQIQLSGKKQMSIHDFLIGQRLPGKWYVAQ